MLTVEKSKIMNETIIQLFRDNLNIPYHLFSLLVDMYFLYIIEKKIHHSVPRLLA